MDYSRTLLAALLAGTSALGAGCFNQVEMTDDLDLTWDFQLTPRRFDEDLHTPYAKGAPVTIYVDSSDEDVDMSRWSVESSDPAVFRIDAVERNSQEISARGVAAGEGIADIIVRDDSGDVVGRGHAEVLIPDRIVLAAHGYLIIGEPDEADVTEARLLEQGTATYLVRYYRGSRELNGNGILSAVTTGDGGVTATARQSYLFENREWLTLTGGAAGLSSVELFADGEPLATLQVVTVPASDVTSIDVTSSDERRADEGDWLVALAQAYDAQGRRIFGVEYTWDIDGQVLPGLGDLFRYEFAPGEFKGITASAAGQAGFTMLQTSGEAYVDSSNEIGCAAAPGAPAGAASLAGLGLAALAAWPLLRRRKR